jgi:hypothetical protein
MDDKTFAEHGLKLSICPSQARWPEPHVLHWQKLHATVDEARERVGQASAVFDAIDKDGDLSPEGRARKKRKLALEALAEFEKSQALASAKKAVEKQVNAWAEKTGLAIKTPTNIAEAVIQSEIRAHVGNMKESKLGFLEKHVTDPVVASAVLGAPGFLSGLKENEIAFVKERVEKHVSPEIAEAKVATVQAMQQAEHGWERAMAKIGERAGLTKGPEGAWRDPKVPEPAVA